MEAGFIKEVDSENSLNSILMVNEKTITLFYASWCGFCRSFLPVFKEQIGRSEYEARIVKIDDLMNPLWEKYDVKVVPTIILFEKERVSRRLDGVLRIGLNKKQLERFLQQTQNMSTVK